MKKLYLVLGFLLFNFVLHATLSDTAKALLMYTYGKDDVDIQSKCTPNEDIWMLKGPYDKEQLHAVEATKIKISKSGVYSGLIGKEVCFIELREGKVDPSFNLDPVYAFHRRLILELIYSSLLQDKETLKNIVTNVENVSFGKAPKAGSGDMDQYGSIISMIPIVRSSSPSSDKISKSITYRIPLGKNGFSLRLVMKENRWKIDSSSKIELPLEFFFQ